MVFTWARRSLKINPHVVVKTTNVQKFGGMEGPDRQQFRLTSLRRWRKSLKIVRAISSYTGIPDYFKVYQQWVDQHEKTGSQHSKNMALHYARVAIEFGQGVIEEEAITCEVPIG